MYLDTFKLLVWGCGFRNKANLFEQPMLSGLQEKRSLWVQRFLVLLSVAPHAAMENEELDWQSLLPYPWVSAGQTKPT